MIARHFNVWDKDDLNPPAAQWVFDPLPATEVAGYIMAPIKGAIGAKQALIIMPCCYMSPLYGAAGVKQGKMSD